jgi:hypothetical protein
VLCFTLGGCQPLTEQTHSATRSTCRQSSTEASPALQQVVRSLSAKASAHSLIRGSNVGSGIVCLKTPRPLRHGEASCYRPGMYLVAPSPKRPQHRTQRTTHGPACEHATRGTQHMPRNEHASLDDTKTQRSGVHGGGSSLPAAHAALTAINSHRPISRGHDWHAGRSRRRVGRWRWQLALREHRGVAAHNEYD